VATTTKEACIKIKTSKNHTMVEIKDTKNKTPTMVETKVEETPTNKRSNIIIISQDNKLSIKQDQINSIPGKQTIQPRSSQEMNTNKERYKINQSSPQTQIVT